MPKVGNKSFPYTAKGIDDAKKEKKRIASGGTPQKRKPKMNTYTYKAKDGSLQAYSNSAAYQAKVGNKAAGKEAAAEKKAKKK